jgi:uncharacterized repeat protein (TIGR01451 family)
VPGDSLTYAITVSNTGGAAATLFAGDVDDTVPAGTTFVAVGSDFSCAAVSHGSSCSNSAPVNVPAGGSVTLSFNVLIDDPLDPAITAIENTVSIAVVNCAASPNSCTVVVPIGGRTPAGVSVSKRAEIRRVPRGGFVPYTIVVTNGGVGAAAGLDVTDTIPSGFRFVVGSATVGGVAATPIVAGRDVTLENLTVGGGASVDITLQLQVLPTTGPGTYVNIAVVEDAAGTPLTTAEAAVEIEAEAVFDCAELLGRVFDDENGNGFQNDGELGLPGVRLATVNGELITTDEHGRFSVPCAALPNAQIGSNFVLKLDERTLPSGYSLTTANPEAIRLTAGKMSRINFGASIGRLVNIALSDAAFVAGSPEPVEELSAGIEQLVQALASERSVVRLTYRLGDGDQSLATERLRRLERKIEEQWRRAGSPYELAIDSRTVQSE